MPVNVLHAIATINIGTAAPSDGRDGSVFYIQIKDLDVERRALVRRMAPQVKRALPVEAGDVLLAARGERPAVIVADPALYGAFPTLDVYLIRPDTAKLDPGYLAAYLSLEHIAMQLRASTTGVLIPRIPKSSLDDLQVPLPPLEHQRTIGALAAAVRQEKRLIERLSSAYQHQRERQLAAAFSTLK